MKATILDALKILPLAVAFMGAGGCRSTLKYQVVPVCLPSSPSAENDAIWVPDQFSTYRVGRYVDPNDTSVMHNAHTLYRREESGRWNLAPGDSRTNPDISRSVGQQDAVMLRDALTAELNRQRAASLALIEQAKTLDTHLRELNVQSQEFQEALKQVYSMRERMTLVSNRLDSIEVQLHALPPSAKAP